VNRETSPPPPLFIGVSYRQIVTPVIEAPEVLLHRFRADEDQSFPPSKNGESLVPDVGLYPSLRPHSRGRRARSRLSFKQAREPVSFPRNSVPSLRDAIDVTYSKEEDPLISPSSAQVFSKWTL